MAGMLLGKRLQRSVQSNRFLQKFFWSLDAFFLATFWSLMKILGPDLASASGKALFRKLGPLSAKHRHVLNNLSIAFPHLDRLGLARLAADSWGNFGAVMAEYPHNKRIFNDPARFELIISAQAKALVGQHKAMIFAVPHLANWELSGACAARIGDPVIVYTPMQNPYVDWMIRRFRLRTGVGLISSRQAASGLYARLKAGQAVGMLPDQRSAAETFFPFFGIPAQTTTAPARLSVSRNCPLFPIRVERLQGAHFRATICDSVEADDPQASRHERIDQVTVKLNQLFEDWIREQPEQWLCTKRRWPKETPKTLIKTASRV
ncbi:MAG: hypothetical protein KZQ58_04940 [gamma proteobacterium symbiont of Bathyaustriella thionipta]|nr:hypothetical protein [gamma proteobacterium symbiont of Bathyaustriella thionipta]